MFLASISICFKVKLIPSDENLRKARLTLYKWARTRNKEFHGHENLLDSMAEVTQSALVLGLPVCVWREFKESKYPAIEWPSKPELVRIWNQQAADQYRRLFDWYDANKPS